MSKYTLTILITCLIGLVVIVGGYCLMISLKARQISHDAHSMSGTMDLMTQALQGKVGDEFDKAFIEEMIVHHEGAVAMAKMANEKAKHSEIKAMAQDIIAAQTREINQMKAWLKAWYGME